MSILVLGRKSAAYNIKECKERPSGKWTGSPVRHKVADIAALDQLLDKLVQCMQPRRAELSQHLCEL